MPPKEKFQKTISFDPRNDNQKDHYKSLRGNSVVVAVGPSGVGKTFTSLSYAADQYFTSGKKIQIVRSLVGVGGEDLGFLKGNEEEKLQPWMETFYEDLCEILGRGVVDTGIRHGNISLTPVAFLRGKTIRDCTLVASECQNLTVMQMKTLLTRQGEGSTFILEGDTNQCDLPIGTPDGLTMVSRVIKTQGLPVPFIKYTAKDCVRSGAVRMWLEAFEKEGI